MPAVASATSDATAGDGKNDDDRHGPTSVRRRFGRSGRPTL